MWGHYFVNPREQVVSEPALVNGCVIVATFEPAGVAVNNCAAPGSARLYGFDPTSGLLNNCLVYSSGPAAWAGKSTSVIELGPVGIPSDLLVVGNQLYFSTSNGSLQSQQIVVNTAGSGVRSYRRIK
jgi:Tfp pilus tip-associated adhesin PilY1